MLFVCSEIIWYHPSFTMHVLCTYRSQYQANLKSILVSNNQPLPSECVAILKAVTELPLGIPLHAQAELLGNHCWLALYGDRKLVKTDERVLAAPVVLKVDDSNSVWLELVKITCTDVSLQPRTKGMHLQPFNDLLYRFTLDNSGGLRLTLSATPSCNLCLTKSCLRLKHWSNNKEDSLFHSGHV